VVESATAWAQATAAASAAGVELRPVIGLQDAEQTMQIVERTWGPGDLSVALIRAFEHAGTVMYRAGIGDRSVGFVLGFPGLREGVHLHSHMLAVLPEWQGRGVGYALKLGQRAACVDLGIEVVRWTYDPLVARNAWFNLVKLGAIATQLLAGFYGEMTDVINRGDRTDRFELVWHLTSERVERALTGNAVAPREGRTLLEPEGDPSAPRPRETGVPAEPGAVVAIPIDHAGLRRRAPALGAAWREASAHAFRACFDEGLVAVWISREGRYVFRPREETP
jgi:predicted GNAT superfamily acetyltransferase